MTEETIRQTALSLGADRAAVIGVDEISFEPSFRSLCEQNACGKYGTSWMCPPHVGRVETLIANATRYRRALVYQIVRPLLDSYDFDGMLAAAREINLLGQALRTALSPAFSKAPLYLGAGACLICKRCAVLDEQPCRFPSLATPSLESYGVDVSKLAKAACMPYVGGAGTVTYFGAALFCPVEQTEKTASEHGGTSA